ncbi:MAG: potassium-transporting ATPase subunit KdpC [Gemmatimonadales bacterium]|nr:potassium-transporting ATPase subunit KdpC [Gemmatimonadales bacterium]
MRHVLLPSFRFLAALTLLTGVAYPAVVTALAAALFPAEAGGSLVLREGRPAGSALLGQPFSAPGHLWSRPSATAPVPYAGGASSGSNLGPSNPALHEAVAARVRALRAADPASGGAVPVDLVTASGSGLDPHVSPAAAERQVARIAAARGMAPDAVRAVIARHTSGRLLGLFGEPRVNVLLVNLDLDGLR